MRVVTNSEKLKAALIAAVDAEKKALDSTANLCGAFIEVFLKPGGEADVHMNPKTKNTVSTR